MLVCLSGTSTHCAVIVYSNCMPISPDWDGVLMEGSRSLISPMALSRITKSTSQWGNWSKLKSLGKMTVFFFVLFCHCIYKISFIFIFTKFLPSIYCLCLFFFTVL